MTVRLWQIDSQEPPRPIGSLPMHYGQFSWSPDGRILLAARNLSGGSKCSVRAWSMPSAKRLAEFPITAGRYPDNWPAEWVGWSPDSKLVATGAAKVELWDPTSGKLLRKIDAQGNGLAWSPDGKTLAAGADHEVGVYDAETGKLLKTLSGCENTILAVAWSPDGKAVAAAGSGATLNITECVCVWDAESGRLLNNWKEFLVGYAPVLRWLDDGKTLALACGGRFAVWDTSSGKRGRRVPTVAFDSSYRDISPDGRVVAFQGLGMIRLESLEDGRAIRTLLPLRDDEYAVLSPDGHVRGSARSGKQFVYVVLTDAGEQLTLTPAEFFKKYGWKNDPSKVNLKAEGRRAGSN